VRPQSTQVANPRTHDQCAYMLTSKQGVPDRRTSLLLLLFTCAALRTKSNGLPIDVPFCFYYCLHVHHHVQKARGFRSTYLFASTSFLHAYKKYGAPDRRTTLILLLFTCASPHIKNKGLPTNTSSYFSYMFMKSKGHQHTHRSCINQGYIHMFRCTNIHIDHEKQGALRLATQSALITNHGEII
jgi:hypothetical protein